MGTKLDDLHQLRIERPTGSLTGRWTARPTRIAAAILFAICIAGTLAWVLHRKRAYPVSVVVTRAEYNPQSGVILSASGYIVPHHRINVNSKVTGRVAWIGVEKGDKVNTGQLLVRLEDDEFLAQVRQGKGAVEAAKATLQELLNGSRPEEMQRASHDLEQSKATLVNDKANWDRTVQLHAAGVESQQQLDDAQARYQSSLEKVHSLEQSYALVKIGPRAEEISRARGNLLEAEGRLAYSQAQLSATEIRAPIAGTILERTAEKGELITAEFSTGDASGPRGSVVALADLSDLQVETDVSQEEFSLLQSNPRAIIYTDAFPDRKYSGRIAEISPEGDRQKGTVSIRVQIASPDQYLRSEMNAKVDFLRDPDDRTLPTSANVYVPGAAVLTRDGKNVVFLAVNNKALRREVVLIKRRAEGWIVSGINAGERVITNPANTLDDDDPIRLQNQPDTKN